MENVVFGVGALVALAMVWRFATKKVRSKGRAGARGVVVGVAPGGAAAAQRRRATFGTVVGVNVICLVGFIVAVAIGVNVAEPFVRVVGGMGVLIVAPWIAFKFLESQDHGSTFSLIGALAAFCVLFWMFGSMWYVGDAIAFVRGLGNG